MASGSPRWLIQSPCRAPGASSSYSTLLRAARSNRPPPPSGCAATSPWLAWLWGEGVPKSKRLNIDKRALEWAHRDPEGLRSAARALASRPTVFDDNAARLLAIVKRHDPFERPGQLDSERLLRGRPQALVEAIEILIARSGDVAHGPAAHSLHGRGHDRRLPRPKPAVIETTSDRYRIALADQSPRHQSRSRDRPEPCPKDSTLHGAKRRDFGASKVFPIRDFRQRITSEGHHVVSTWINGDSSGLEHFPINSAARSRGRA